MAPGAFDEGAKVTLTQQLEYNIPEPALVSRGGADPARNPAVEPLRRRERRRLVTR
jgi:hypothetical protein